MPNNIAISITADVADLTAKRAVMSAELKAATKDLNDLAKAAKGGMTDELRAKMLQAATAVAKTRAELSQLNGEMAKLGKEGNAAALANVVGGLKSTVLEEASAKLGPLGRGLEALGPAGLVGAAGIAAVGAAFEGAAKTAEWAEQLERASKTLGLTTSQLQAFDFVANAAGIPVDRMRESLGGLEKTIGLVESGLARSMTTKAFTDGLKITPEQLRGWGDLEHQLPHIVEALAKLDPEERAAISQRLKIDPEVVTSLVAAKDGLGNLIDEAHRFGIVMDEEAVHKSAEAAEKLHVLSAVVQGELRVAFANLAPVISDSANEMTRLAVNAADVARGTAVVAQPLADMVGGYDKLGAVVKDATGALIDQIPVLGQTVQLLEYLREQGGEARKTAELHDLLDKFILNPEEKKAKPQKLTEGTGKGPSVVSQWMEQLHAQEIASGEFFKDQTATELAFWQSKLGLTKAGSKEWLEVQSKIYEGQKGLAHQAYDERIADLNDQMEADRNNFAQEKADWTAKLTFIAGKYGEQSVQYRTAHREFQQAERAHQRQMAEIAKSAEQERLAELQNTLKTEAEIRRSNASLAEAQIGQNARGSASPIAEVTAAAQVAALHRQLNHQEIADLEALYAKEDNLRTQAVVDNLQAFGTESIQYQQAIDAKKKADAEFYNHHRALEAQMVNETKQDSLKVQQAWSNAVGPMVHSFGSGITGLVKGTETLSQALANVGETILDVIITAIERWVTAQIVAMITGQAAGKTAAAGQVATNIALAGSGGVASMAAAPFPIDLGAPAFGAAMAAQAAAYGSIAAFAQGTNVVPSDMIAQIHAGERIIPAADNRQLMAAVSGGGRATDAGDTHLHFTNAPTVHGHGMEDVVSHLDRNSRDVIRLMQGWARGGHLNGVFRSAGMRP
jgi:uncharacterized protein YfeS